MSAVLDTHSVLWYLENSPELSNAARSAIEKVVDSGQNLYVSVISLVELIYLTERGRISLTAFERLEKALAQTGSSLEVASIDMDVAATLRRIPRDAVPDMPDRIIAATALKLALPLITRDRRLRSAGLETIW